MGTAFEFGRRSYCGIYILAMRFGERAWPWLPTLGNMSLESLWRFQRLRQMNTLENNQRGKCQDYSTPLPAQSQMAHRRTYSSAQEPYIDMSAPARHLPYRCTTH